jgi:hypothetical protein
LDLKGKLPLARIQDGSWDSHSGFWIPPQSDELVQYIMFFSVRILMAVMMAVVGSGTVFSDSNFSALLAHQDEAKGSAFDSLTVV